MSTPEASELTDFERVSIRMGDLNNKLVFEYILKLQALYLVLNIPKPRLESDMKDVTVLRNGGSSHIGKVVKTGEGECLIFLHKSTVQVVQALVLSQLVYCPVIWSRVAKKGLKRGNMPCP